MGKHYTIIENFVYIYSTGSDEAFDLSTLPSELEIFNEKVEWQISPWLAMSQTINNDSLRTIEEILTSQGFVKTMLAQSVLESYFMTGNRNLLSTFIEDEVDESSDEYKFGESAFEVKIMNDKLMLAKTHDENDNR